MENTEMNEKGAGRRFRPMRMVLAAAAVAMAGTGIGVAWEYSEKKKDEAAITLSQMPESVRATLEQNRQGGEVRAMYQEKGGSGNFEAVIRSAGKDREIKISPAGQLLEVEEKLALADLPPEVRTALAKQGGEGEAEGIEKVTTGDGKVYYEAVVEKEDQEVGVKLLPDGTPYSDK